MTMTRLFAVPAIVTIVLLAGCGTETGSTGETDIGTSTAPTNADPTPSADTPSAEPSTPAPPDGADDIGTVVVNTALGIEAGDFPGSPMPRSIEVSGADELETTYTGVPGIAEVAAAVAADPPAPGERLFVYVVAACLVEDISLELTGKQLAMVVAGNTTIKCQPPPMRMVVWKVGADEVPADTVPAQAVLKK